MGKHLSLKNHKIAGTGYLWYQLLPWVLDALVLDLNILFALGSLPPRRGGNNRVRRFRMRRFCRRRVQMLDGERPPCHVIMPQDGVSDSVLERTVEGVAHVTTVGIVPVLQPAVAHGAASSVLRGGQFQITATGKHNKQSERHACRVATRQQERVRPATVAP